MAQHPSRPTAPSHPHQSTSVHAQTSSSASGEQQTLAIYQGPLPSPLVLKEYNEILPGAADRFMTMAETEQRNRWLYENKVLDMESKDRESDRKLTTQNRYMALFLVYGFIGLGVIFVFTGHEQIAMIAFGGGAISGNLNGWFRYNNNPKQ